MPCIGVRYNVASFIHLPPDHRCQLTVTVDAEPRQGQSGVACIEFVVRLFNDNSFHIFTCQASFQDR